MEYAIKVNNKYESIEFNIVKYDIFYKVNVIQTEGKDKIILQAKIGNNSYSDYMVINGKNRVTKIDFTKEVTLKLVSNKPFSYEIPNYVIPKYYNKNKVEDFLYEITYGNIDYEYAYRYFNPILKGGCSSIRNGNYFGRNFDWLYNNQVQFVVHTPSSLEHNGVIGISGIIPNIEKDNVDNDDIIIEGVDMFKLVPFYLLDGINDKGLFCTHNVVSLDNSITPTRIIHAKKEEKDIVSIPMLVRFILDKFSNVNDCIDYLVNYTTLYFTDEMLSSGYQSHFMIGDLRRTYIIEFINNEIKIIQSNYITNFNIYNVKFDRYKHIQYPPTLYGIDKYGSGLERWDIISNNYRNAKTKDGMRKILDLIQYSNCYKEPFWYSEIVKMEDDNGDIITVDTPTELCTDAKNQMKYYFENKDRDNPKVWITCHSCVYDIKNKIVYVKNQENIVENKFQI